MDASARSSTNGQSMVELWTRRVVSLLTVVIAAAFIAAIGIAVFSPDETRSTKSRPAQRANLAKLTESTTETRLSGAPADQQPAEVTSGEVIRPTTMLGVYAKPGRQPFAKIGPRQIGPTWLPVVERSAGWSRVLLPSRPNGSTGWLRTADLERKHSSYLVRVHAGSRSLELIYNDKPVGTWPVAVGQSDTPTPTGRTFVLGSITDSSQSYSPVILPLGTHSQTLDTYGGGAGTVALHTWPDASVFGTAASHGCVRVPADALDRLTQVPLGTLVVIDQA